jgi:tetratricopeptide (TPR) repeat protein
MRLPHVIAMPREPLISLFFFLAAVCLMPPGRADTDVLLPILEHGVGHVLRGETAAADSLFRAVLHRSPRDPRALTNLGNLCLLRGEARLALSYYQSASVEDPKDAGIRLNRALAFLALGLTANATHEAALALDELGGIDAAYERLGLDPKAEDREKQGDNESFQMSEEDLRSFLQQALKEVPRRRSQPDSSKTGDDDGGGKLRRISGKDFPLIHTMPLGPRATEPASPITSCRCLYWKL